MIPQRLFASTAQHLAALGLAAVTTLAILSSMTGLAGGYRDAQMLALAASQPVASIAGPATAAPARKPKA